MPDQTKQRIIETLAEASYEHTIAYEKAKGAPTPTRPFNKWRTLPAPNKRFGYQLAERQYEALVEAGLIDRAIAKDTPDARS